MELEVKFYIQPNESFEAEGRYFFKEEVYPVYDKNGNSLLVGENGEFYFTNDLMTKAIIEWDLYVITLDDIDFFLECSNER